MIKMMTKEEVFALVEEFEVEKKKTVKVPHYYKYKGEIRRRSYDDRIFTDRYEEILHMLYDEKGPTAIFRCSCCGAIKPYGGMEFWEVEAIFSDEDGICSLCYEEEMGEDL